jgi:hypothetical protein
MLAELADGNSVFAKEAMLPSREALLPIREALLPGGKAWPLLGRHGQVQNLAGYDKKI